MHQLNKQAVQAALLDALRAVLFRPASALHWKVSGGRRIGSRRAYYFVDNNWTHYLPKPRVLVSLMKVCMEEIQESRGDA